MLTATDGDGDPLIGGFLAGSFAIKVEDDVPVLAGGEDERPQVGGQVQEDALTSGNSEGTGQSASASGAAGTLNNLVNFGADGAGSFGLGSDVSSLTAQGLTSGGVALSYSVVGNVLTASAGSVPVFTLTVGADGSYSFTLSGPLDHPVADGDDSEQLAGVGIDFSGVLTATDGDGDPLTGGFLAGSFVIRVEDDVSVALIETVDISDLSLVTQDAQTIGELFDTDSADFSAAFAAAVTANYGADGPGDTKVIGYNLTVSNAVSGLSSNGKPITLVLVEGDIVGRADGVDIFKISVSAGGTVSVTQYAEIDHLPEDADGVDENSNLSLGAGKGQLTATVTVTDGDNDVVSKLVSVDLGSSVSFDDDLPSVDANMAVQLDDDALASGIAGGTGDDPNAVNVSGTLGHSFGADGAGSIQWLTTGAPAGFTYETNPAGALLVKQGATTVLTVTLNSATGAYSVTQNSPIQHANADQENNQAFTLNYQVNDGDGDTATGTLAINVDDDTPVAKNDTAIVAESSGKDFNVAFVLDSSGSINGTEFATMMAAVRAAGQTLFNGTDGSVQITIVAFSTGATSYTAVSSLAAFESLVDNILANRPFNDNTNFTAAVEQTMDVYDPIPGWSNQVFFISDGSPNVDTGVNNSLQSGTATDWNNFIDSNGINVTTIGVGNGINSTRLQDVDLDGSGSPILVADFDDLIDTLLGQISGNVVGGNVLLGNDNVVGGGDDDAYGADSAGRVLSIEIDGVTYTWNGGDIIAVSTGGSIAGSQLKNILTDLGGKLSFNFADGTWSYTAQQSVPSDTSESFDYVIIDKDGDPSQATLTVNIEDAAPVIGRVDEDELPGGITDNDTQTTVATGSLTELLIGNGPATFSLQSSPAFLPTLTSDGVAVTYNVAGNTLTAMAGAATIFTLVVQANGAYTFTLSGPLDHPLANGDDNEILTLNLTEAVKATNGVNPVPLAGDLLIQVEDDVPAILATSNLVYSNSGNPGGATGVFDYSTGADTRGSGPFSAVDSDFKSITLTGNVGGTVISSQSITWVSENATTATFDIEFDYAPNPAKPGVKEEATGTLTFDKVNGTYTMTLDGPIEGFQVLKTSAALGITGYVPGGYHQSGGGGFSAGR